MKKAAYKFLREGGNHAIIYGPPRSGKTYTFSSIAVDFDKHNKKVLIVTDRDELLGQTGNSLKNMGLNCFYIQAGCKVVNDIFNIHVAMSQTLRNRIKQDYWKKFISTRDLIIIDENHIQEFNYLFESGLIENIWVLGFTGTPKRTGKMRQLGIDYEKIIIETSPTELLKLGKLVQADIYSCGTVDTSDIKINHLDGDYNKSQLFKKFDNRQLYTGVVKNYNDICPNTKFIEYCVSKTHAIKSAIEFYEAGIDVKFIVSHSSQPKPPVNENSEGDWVRYEEKVKDYELYKKWLPILSGNRRDIFTDFYNSKYTGLINVDIATKGYDCPSIETVILNYKTLSLTRFLQSAMRGATENEGKTHYNLLDFGGNCGIDAFGDPLEERLWSLWHEKIEGEGLPPVKECGFTSEGTLIINENKKGCRRLILASFNICPFCGFKYPDKNVKEIELQAIMFDSVAKIAVKTKKIKDMSMDELHDYWKSKRHKPAWLWRQLWYKGREEMIEKFGKEYNWKQATIKKAINFCEKF